MRTFLKRITPLNAAIAIGSPLLVILWHLIATWDEARLHKIAVELSSTVEFFGAPHPNHAGTKLFYAQTSNDGINAYVIEPATGQKMLLFSHEQAHLQGVGLLGWSPQDGLFAYSIRSPHGEIFICDGNSSKTLATVAESKIILDGVWLSEAALVYVNNNQDLSLLQKSGDEWHKSGLFPKQSASEPDQPGGALDLKPAKGKKSAARGTRREPVQCLAALSGNSVAWKQGGTVWKYELGADAPVKVWEAGTNVLLNFAFYQERNLFRLNCTNVNGQFIIDFSPANAWDGEHSTASGEIKPANGGEITTWTFLSHGLGYAYLVRSPTLDSIVIQASSNSVPVQLSWKGGADAFSASDHSLYVIGAPTNGPLGIWSYDIRTGSLSCSVSGTERPFKYAKVVNATDAVTANADGAAIVYHLFPPANFVAGRKYPLAIGFTGHRWGPQEAAVVNAGCFLATCNGILPEGDVLAVYRAVVQNPGVDTNRVYAIGISAGAGLAEQLLQGSPELWRGAILLSPVFFPPPSKLKVARILIDSGGNDTYLKESGGTGKLVQFQDAAALAGIPVTLALHEQATHVYRSKTAEAGRIQAILEFLAAD